MKHSPNTPETSGVALAAAEPEAPEMVSAQIDPMVATIEKVALDPNADIGKLEKMLDMKERIDDRARQDREREAEREFYRALNAAQTSIPLVARTRKNTFSGYTYADLADIETQAMPIIRDHGFAVAAWSGAGAPDGYQRVHLRVSHVGGHSHEICDDFPLDSSGTGGKTNKTPVQAKGSTTSYGRRYLLCGYFGIATADDDGSRREASRPETISAKDACSLRDLITKSGTDESKFLKAAKAQTIEDIAASDVTRLKSLLERKLKEGADNV
ncbi:ERF superfamily protein [Roseovarius sp. A-2]|uniref:ERF family protein n=1 Tax=Roseovarius sp. A-2 TaxID=1570360 RepID=UPI0009B58691|nr:ERF family protein [Roseovarius sp. A-2]GAW33544.1 ERF superfamily protein [Roseovarius sp. A-2]